MKRCDLIGVLLFAVAFTGKGQISVTSADMAKLYEAGTYQMHFAAESVQVNIGTASSSPQNFSISFAPTQTVTFTNYSVPQGNEPFSKFPSATHAAGFSVPLSISPETTLTTTVYQFVKITDDTMTSLGVALRQQWTPAMPPLPADTISYDYSVDVVTPLPLHYGYQTSKTDTTYDWISSGLYSFTTTVESVDGFGSMVTPQGTFPVLRMTGLVVKKDFAAPSTVPYNVDSSYTVSFIGNQGVRIGVDIQKGYPATGVTLAEYVSIVIVSQSPSAVKTNRPTTTTGFQLNQNYPNPFNPSTTVSFSLPRGGMTTLKVYDILGKEVATLVDESLAEGFYTIPFDATVLSSGVYVYTIRTGEFIQTKKMIVAK